MLTVSSCRFFSILLIFVSSLIVVNDANIITTKESKLDMENGLLWIYDLSAIEMFIANFAENDDIKNHGRHGRD